MTNRQKFKKLEREIKRAQKDILERKFIRHLARWAAFVSYKQTKEGDVFVFNDYQVAEYAQQFVERLGYTVTKIDVESDYSFGVSK